MREKRLKVETVKKIIEVEMLVLVCQYCLDLYSLYPSKIVNSETSPHFEHDNALDTKVT